MIKELNKVRKASIDELNKLLESNNVRKVRFECLMQRLEEVEADRSVNNGLMVTHS